MKAGGLKASLRQPACARDPQSVTSKGAVTPVEYLSEPRHVREEIQRIGPPDAGKRERGKERGVDGKLGPKLVAEMAQAQRERPGAVPERRSRP